MQSWADGSSNLPPRRPRRVASATGLILLTLLLMGTAEAQPRDFAPQFRSCERLLSRSGVNPASRAEGWAICGYVYADCRGLSPIANARVTALDNDLHRDDVLGSGVADREGRFVILYSQRDFDDRRTSPSPSIDPAEGTPDLYFRIESTDGRLILEEPRRSGLRAERRVSKKGRIVILCSDQGLVADDFSEWDNTRLTGPVEDCVSFNPKTTTLKNVDGRWKIVDGNHYLFDFESNVAEASRSLDIIKHYGMNKSCFVGRPDPSFSYLLVDKKAPEGSMQGEDCVGFNPQTATVKKVRNSWKIIDGSHWMFDFGSKESEARKSLSIIKRHGFTHSCFVGRPGPSFKYLRRSPNIDISGWKWHDINGNGVWDEGEPGLQGWEIELDGDGDGAADQTAVTDSKGRYSFTSLSPGTYTVSEPLPSGWTNTYDGSTTVAASSGMSFTGDFQQTEPLNFGNHDQAPQENLADLAITKTDSPDPVTAGEELTYTVKVTNNGPSEAQNVVVTDTLPARTTVTGCVQDPSGPLVTYESDTGNCQHSAGTLTCILGNLASGDDTSFDITVEVPDTLDISTVLCNTAKASSDTPDPNPTAAETTIETHVSP